MPLPVGKKDQLNGNLQVQAVDAADLSSRLYDGHGHIVVVDSISPKLDASYSFENATEHYQKVEEDVNEKKVNHHYMDKPRVVIADTDENYIQSIELKFIEDFFDKVQLEIITDQEYFE